MRFACFLLAILAFWPAPTRAQNPSQNTASSDFSELILLEKSKTARIRLEILIDGKPVQTHWRRAFAELFQSADRDKNGELTQTEAASLPGCFALRQGPPYLHPGFPPPWNDLDENRDGRILPEELSRYYTHRGLGGLLVGIGHPVSTADVTAALWRQLDRDSDGKLDPAPSEKRVAAFLKLDANEDELISPAELAPDASYPGSTASDFLASPRQDQPLAESEQAAPFLFVSSSDPRWADRLLARRDADRDGRLTPPEAGFSTELFARLDESQDGTLSSQELLAWSTLPPDFNWTINLDEAAPSPTTDFALDNLRLSFRAAPGTLPETLQKTIKRFRLQFSEADANRDAILSADELAPASAAELRQLAPIAGTAAALTAKELDAWLALQTAVASGHVTLRALHYGPGLFELLDRDHDGVLSLREIAAIQNTLLETGVIDRDAKILPQPLPQTLILTASQGAPRSAYRPPHSGPSWFLAMDRNGDGDISSREFPGAPASFSALDADRDGLLTPTEAAAAPKAQEK